MYNITHQSYLRGCIYHLIKSVQARYVNSYADICARARIQIISQSRTKFVFVIQNKVSPTRNSYLIPNDYFEFKYYLNLNYERYFVFQI